MPQWLAGTRSAIRIVGALAAITALPALAQPSAPARPTAPAADAFPTRPARLVVPYAPGGSTDVLARLLAQGLATALGQPVVVENRAGGNTIIATEMVARSPADGHTLLFAVTTTATNTLLYERLGYSMRDFAPVANVVKVPFVLAVAPSSPLRDLRDLLALANSRPDGITNAIVGRGGTVHLTGEMFRRTTGIRMLDVPYRGMGPAVADLIAGTVDIAFDGSVSSLPQMQAGTLRLLGVTHSERLPGAPELPTFVEQGFPDMVAYSWYGVLAPAGTPPAVVSRLGAEIVAVSTSPAFRVRMEAGGAIVDPQIGAAFGRFIDEELERWAELIRAMGLRLEQ